MENLATVLTHLMTANNLSASELARKTGITQPVIHRLMTGATVNPQILTLKPIADYFGVSIDQLLGYVTLENRGIVLHNINNKLSTIKTITSVLIDILPELINAYQKAIAANLINETIPANILPLVQLNITTLITAANQIQESLIKQ